MTKKERIARARRCIAYADRCVKDARALNLPPEQLAAITASADAVRDPAKKLLQILLSDKSNSEQDS